MSAKDPSRHALYTGLAEKLGPELADGLMDFLTTPDLTDLPTKADFARLGADFGRLEADFARLGADFARLETGFARLEADIARLEDGMVTRADFARFEDLTATKASQAELEARLTRDISQATNRILLTVIGGNAAMIAGLIAVAFK